MVSWWRAGKGQKSLGGAKGFPRRLRKRTILSSFAVLFSLFLALLLVLSQHVIVPLGLDLALAAEEGYCNVINHPRPSDDSPSAVYYPVASMTPEGGGCGWPEYGGVFYQGVLGPWQARLLGATNSGSAREGDDRLWLVLGWLVNEDSNLTRFNLLRSNDGGQTWVPAEQNPAQSDFYGEYLDAVLVPNALGGGRVVAVYTGTDGRLYYRLANLDSGGFGPPIPLMGNTQSGLLGRKPRMALVGDKVHIAFLNGGFVEYVALSASSLQEIPSSHRVLNGAPGDFQVIYPSGQPNERIPYPSLAVSGVGNTLRVYCGSGNALWGFLSLDGGVTFSSPWQYDITSPYFKLKGGLSEVHFVSSVAGTDPRTGKDVFLTFFSARGSNDFIFDPVRQVLVPEYRLIALEEFFSGGEWQRDYQQINLYNNELDPGRIWPPVVPSFSAPVLEPIQVPAGDRYAGEWLMVRLRFTFSEGKHKTKEFLYKLGEKPSFLEDVTTVNIPEPPQPIPEDFHFIHVAHTPDVFSDCRIMEGGVDGPGEPGPGDDPELDYDDLDNMPRDWRDNPYVAASVSVSPGRAYFAYVGIPDKEATNRPGRQSFPLYAQFARTLWRSVTHGEVAEVTGLSNSFGYVGSSGQRVSYYGVTHQSLREKWGNNERQERIWGSDRLDNVVWVKPNTYDFDFRVTLSDFHDENWDLTGYFPNLIARLGYDGIPGHVRGVNALIPLLYPVSVKGDMTVGGLRYPDPGDPYRKYIPRDVSEELEDWLPGYGEREDAKLPGGIAHIPHVPAGTSPMGTYSTTFQAQRRVQDVWDGNQLVSRDLRLAFLPGVYLISFEAVSTGGPGYGASALGYETIPPRRAFVWVVADDKAPEIELFGFGPEKKRLRSLAGREEFSKLFGDFFSTFVSGSESGGEPEFAELKTSLISSHIPLGFFKLLGSLWGPAKYFGEVPRSDLFEVDFCNFFFHLMQDFFDVPQSVPLAGQAGFVGDLVQMVEDSTFTWEGNSDDIVAYIEVKEPAVKGDGWNVDASVRQYGVTERPLPGVGLDRVEYSLDGSNWTVVDIPDEGNYQSYLVGIPRTVMPEPGRFYGLRIRAYDKLGNVSEKVFSVRYTVGACEIGFDINPSPDGENGWWITKPNVSFNMRSLNPSDPVERVDLFYGVPIAEPSIYPVLNSVFNDEGVVIYQNPIFSPLNPFFAFLSGRAFDPYSRLGPEFYLLTPQGGTSWGFPGLLADPEKSMFGWVGFGFSVPSESLVPSGGGLFYLFQDGKETKNFIGALRSHVVGECRDWLEGAFSVIPEQGDSRYGWYEQYINLVDSYLAGDFETMRDIISDLLGPVFSSLFSGNLQLADGFMSSLVYELVTCSPSLLNPEWIGGRLAIWARVVTASGASRWVRVGDSEHPYGHLGLGEFWDWSLRWASHPPTFDKNPAFFPEGLWGEGVSWVILHDGICAQPGWGDNGLGFPLLFGDITSLDGGSGFFGDNGFFFYELYSRWLSRLIWDLELFSEEFLADPVVSSVLSYIDPRSLQGFSQEEVFFAILELMSRFLFFEEAGLNRCFELFGNEYWFFTGINGWSLSSNPKVFLAKYGDLLGLSPSEDPPYWWGDISQHLPRVVISLSSSTSMNLPLLSFRREDLNSLLPLSEVPVFGLGSLRTGFACGGFVVRQFPALSGYLPKLRLVEKLSGFSQTIGCYTHIEENPNPYFGGTFISHYPLFNFRIPFEGIWSMSVEGKDFAGRAFSSEIPLVEGGQFGWSNTNSTLYKFGSGGQEALSAFVDLWVRGTLALFGPWRNDDLVPVLQDVLRNILMDHFTKERFPSADYVKLPDLQGYRNVLGVDFTPPQVVGVNRTDENNAYIGVDDSVSGLWKLEYYWERDYERYGDVPGIYHTYEVPNQNEKVSEAVIPLRSVPGTVYVRAMDWAGNESPWVPLELPGTGLIELSVSHRVIPFPEDFSTPGTGFYNPTGWMGPLASFVWWGKFFFEEDSPRFPLLSEYIDVFSDSWWDIYDLGWDIYDLFTTPLVFLVVNDPDGAIDPSSLSFRVKWLDEESNVLLVVGPVFSDALGGWAVGCVLDREVSGDGSFEYEVTFGEQQVNGQVALKWDGGFPKFPQDSLLGDLAFYPTEAMDYDSLFQQRVTPILNALLRERLELSDDISVYPRISWVGPDSVGQFGMWVEDQESGILEDSSSAGELFSTVLEFISRSLDLSLPEPSRYPGFLYSSFREVEDGLIWYEGGVILPYALYPSPSGSSFWLSPSLGFRSPDMELYELFMSWENYWPEILGQYEHIKSGVYGVGWIVFDKACNITMDPVFGLIVGDEQPPEFLSSPSVSYDDGMLRVSGVSVSGTWPDEFLDGLLEMLDEQLYVWLDIQEQYPALLSINDWCSSVYFQLRRIGAQDWVSYEVPYRFEDDSPFIQLWDGVNITGLAPGDYEYRFVAYDLAGNKAATAPVPLNVPSESPSGGGGEGPETERGTDIWFVPKASLLTRLEPWESFGPIPAGVASDLEFSQEHQGPGVVHNDQSLWKTQGVDYVVSGNVVFATSVSPITDFLPLSGQRSIPISRLEIRADSGTWVRFVGVGQLVGVINYGDPTGAPAGVSYSFALRLTPPADTPPGNYRASLSFVTYQR